ncbi:hypothetical protein Bbelb_047320, partial [Branchiostoma belcheri]
MAFPPSVEGRVGVRTGHVVGCPASCDSPSRPCASIQRETFSGTESPSRVEPSLDCCKKNARPQDSPAPFISYSRPSVQLRPTSPARVLILSSSESESEPSCDPRVEASLSQGRRAERAGVMDIKSVAVRWIYHGRTRSDSTLSALLLAVLISHHVATIAGIEIELPEGSADLIDIFQLRGLPKGINKAIGFCENRPDGPDVAYRVSKDATLVVPTTELFPNDAEKTFPVDFSVLLTVKPSLASRSYLFTVIVENNVQFGVQLADVDWVFLYADGEGRPGFEESPRFNHNVADGQWHRIAFSVQRNKVSMIMDCDIKNEVTMDLDRSPGAEGAIRTDGMTAFGRHFFRENVAYEGTPTNMSPPATKMSTFLPQLGQPGPESGTNLGSLLQEWGQIPEAQTKPEMSRREVLLDLVAGTMANLRFGK